MNAEKKLLRPKDGRMIAGVCAGIARYFAVDVTLVRVVWALLTIFPGGIFGGIIAYVVCWAIIPEEEAPAAS